MRRLPPRTRPWNRVTASTLIFVLSLIPVGIGVFAPIGGAQSQSDLDTPLTAPGGPSGLLGVQPVWRPAPMVVRGKSYLVYELNLTNFQTAPVTLEFVRVDSGAAGTFNFQGATLKSMADLPDRYGAAGNELTMEPLKTRLLLLWLPLVPPNVPHRLVHTIGYRLAPGNSPRADRKLMTVVTKALPVDDKSAPLIIGPPLRGNNWLAANGPSNTSAHRRAFMVAGGQIYFPERFAIDFVQLGADGRTYSGDPKNNRSYHAYGADILAVADGRVVDIKAGIPDNVPGSVSGPITMATIGGNYMIEDIGNGACAFYAHLKPGSLKIIAGAKVKRGQVLASLGNSGNSSEPHLHFHIISRPFPLAGNGVPYAFDHFSIVPGRVKESAEEIGFVFGVGQPAAASDSLVLENAVIDFP